MAESASSVLDLTIAGEHYRLFALSGMLIEGSGAGEWSYRFLPTTSCTELGHDERGGACPYCCARCNTDEHWCPGCGEPLLHDQRTEAISREPHPRCWDDGR